MLYFLRNFSVPDPSSGPRQESDRSATPRDPWYQSTTVPETTDRTEREIAVKSRRTISIRDRRPAGVGTVERRNGVVPDEDAGPRRESVTGRLAGVSG